MNHNTHLFKLGHVLIKVPDLHQAVAEYEALGFTVTWGSDPTTAHNALLHLQDGAFLELFAVPQVGVVKRTLIKVGAALNNASMKRFELYLFGPLGLTDYAVDAVADFAETVRRVRANGTGFGKPMRLSRTRPDGVKLTWSLSLSPDTQLPFIMSPYDPDSPPPKEAMTHQNGVTGVKTLIIAVPNWEQAVARYGRLFQQAGQRGMEDGRELARFSTATAAIHLVPGAVHRIEDVVLAAASGEDVCFAALHR